MSRRFPTAVLVGLGAALAGMVLWTTEQLTGSWFFGILAVTAKLVLLVAFPWCLPDLSAHFHVRPLRSALLFAVTAILITTAVAAAYLPWRDSFCRHFNNDAYRWYWSGLTETYPGQYKDFNAWLAGWRSGRTHLLEFAVLTGFYVLTTAGLSLFRLRRSGGWALAGAAYAFLLVVPVATGLIVWDYDIFLRGIASDSISLDLFPFTFWFSGDHTIFFYVFFFVFFAVAALFVTHPIITLPPTNVPTHRPANV